MRLLSYRHQGRDHVGVRQGDSVIPVTELGADLPPSLQELLAADALNSLESRLPSALAPALQASEVEYRPLVAKPGKILCIGRNYAAHAAEGGAETPSFPEVFLRSATSLVAHRGRLVRPQCSDKFDYEGEFAFVIGKSCRHAREDQALQYVAGYTLFNDATVRDYQRFSTQWTVGKNFDGSGAFGPELVTPDELPPGLEGMTLTTRLNGSQVQLGHIDDLVFPVRRLIAILSECMTLEAGDVVVTGTPAGVGVARTPPLFLKAGDRVEVEVAGLGKLVNTVKDEV